MREWRLRRQCRRMLQDLGIQPPLDVEELCKRVGQRRGRPIRLVPHPLTVPGPFGAWIASPTADYLLYQEATSKVHQDHIILHELGHILAGHRSDELNPEVASRVLLRTCYDSEYEREAETVATIILEWASVLDRVAVWSSTTTATRRMETALGDRLGWL